MNARPHSRIGLILLMALACATPGASQIVGGARVQSRPGMPEPRDPRQQPQAGTANVSGRVTSADTGAALRRVQVRVAGQELRGTRSAMTDAEGRFTVTNLPAGRYSVSFTKGGYASMQYGQKRPNQPGKLIDLADGQKLDKLDVALIRGGVIAGRIVDDFGEPMVEARVQVMQLRWVNSGRRPVGAGRGDQTNDRGEFRIWGLGPGEYFVSASSTDRQMFMEPAAAALDASDQSGFAPTYYPGTTSLDEAQKVTVAAGQEVSNIDFALQAVRTVRVSGTAMTSEGRPMTNATVMMFPRMAMQGGGMMMPFGARTDSNGAFTITGVAPGDYVLQARTDPMMGEDMRGGEAARAAVTVGSEDVKNVMLAASRGVRVRGRVVFEGSTATAGIKEGLRVFMPAVENEPMMFGPGGIAQVNTEGTFEATGVSGRRTFSVSAQAPWVLKAVRIGGTDVLDTGYEFGKEDVSNVEIVLTSRAPTLTGSVKADNDTPASDYVVLAYSTDEASWQHALRRGSSVGRPDQNGVYKITGLRPGSYYVVALDEFPEDWGDPELFKALASHARQVTLREGQSERLDLALQTPPGS